MGTDAIAQLELWPEEEWRAVPGYEGLYQVSSWGRVLSLPRKSTQGGIRKLQTNSKGYQYVALCKDGVVRTHSVHELVAAAFYGPRPAWAEVIRHLDDDPSHNHADNLTYGTFSENMFDRGRHGHNQGRATKGKGKPKRPRRNVAVEFDDLPGEEWRPVPGYEGYYGVSNLGRVRSLRRQTAKGMSGGRLLKPGPSGKYGYLMVTLSKEGCQRRVPVHALVAAAFLGSRPEGMVVLHGPNGNQDNRASELHYGTEKENQRDRLRDGTDNRGEKHRNSKLTQAMVDEIRQRYAAGETSFAMAPDYGVVPSTIRAVLSGFSWGHSGEAVLNGPRRGTSHQDARLTDALVLECRRRHAAGESINSIAKAFGMSWSAMGKAIRGETWTHVPVC